MGAETSQVWEASEGSACVKRAVRQKSHFFGKESRWKTSSSRNSLFAPSKPYGEEGW